MKTVRRLLLWLRSCMEPGRPTRSVIHDPIGDTLRAAIAADETAKIANAQTHQARVDAMIDDFFSKYGDRDARHHS